jgi:hypothetical protein
VESDTHKGNFDDASNILEELGVLKDFNVHINTNVPEKFKGLPISSLDIYTRPVFSYVEKLIYAVKKSIELKDSVILVDASKLDIIIEDSEYFKSLDGDTILTQVKWEEDAIMGLKLSGWWRHIREYCELIGLDYNNLIPKYEQTIYFPYDEHSKELLIGLEEFKVVLEFSNLWHKPNILFEKTGRWGFGQGEGIVLAAALEKLNIKTEEFEKVNTNKYMLEYKKGPHFEDVRSPLVLLNNTINCSREGSDLNQKYQEVVQSLFVDETKLYIEESTYNFVRENYGKKLSEYFIMVHSNKLTKKEKSFSDIIIKKYGLDKDCWVLLPIKPVEGRHLFDIKGYEVIKNVWFKSSSRQFHDTKSHWTNIKKLVTK